MNEESLFDAALEKPPAERQAFLDQACGGDFALRGRVEKLLAADERSEGVLERALEATAMMSALPPPPLAPDRLFGGRFRLRQKLGEGGMGEVWVADQTEPVERRVALKVIRPGFDSERLLARFEQERQALALMDHPNIAKVLDAGVADTRPYFVMEVIKGVPITRYCDGAKLSPRERLELFIPVCQAVQHAHQKGIIHRDLKPSNILVALYDGRPMPKVIDFGVAKATGPPLTEKSIYTEVGTLIGTLEYMSPEQAELNNLDIDTRSDIYTLGVVLYELLTGDLPFSRQELRAAAFTEMLRMIKEVEPAKPSTRLSNSGTLPSVAAVRQTEPKKLVALMRGDLDWIVVKCLEKDRARRYESANGLAQDIERYQADEPVIAGPPSASYRFRKFVRRNRKVLFTLIIIALLMVVGSVVSIWQAIRATQAKEEEAKQRQLAVEESDRANDESAVAKAVNEFLQKDLLGQADIGNQPAGSERNNNLTVRELLDRAALGIESSFKGQEKTEAAIRLTLGKAYLALGEYPQAQKHLERSLELRKEKLGAAHSDTLWTLHSLASLHGARGEYDQAERLFKDVLSLRSANLGSDHADTLQTMNDLGLLYCDNGHFEDAERLLNEALEVRRANLGSDHLDTLVSLSSFAALYFARRQFDAAEPLFKQVCAGFVARLGPDHPTTLTATTYLAATYLNLGRLDEAEPLFTQNLALYRVKLGPQHPSTLDVMQNLADVHQRRRRYEQAETVLKQVIEARRAKQGADHPTTLQSISNLAAYYLERGLFDQVEPLFKQVVDAERRTLGADHPDTLVAFHNLAVHYRDRSRYEEAEPLFQEALTGAKKKLGLGDERTQTIIGNFVELRNRQGKPQLAEPMIRELVTFLRDHPPSNPALYADELGYLASNLLEQKKYAEAEPFARECLSIRIWSSRAFMPS
ncbi:MAG: tetratricopeptide repeat protein [Gemmataceae bacterium]